MATISKRTWGEGKTAWVCRYTDQNGKRRLKTFPTRKAADAWLVTARGEVAVGKHTPDSSAPTLQVAAEAWIKRGEADQLEDSTIRQRRQHVDHHILVLMDGRSKLSKLNLENFRDELLRTRSRALAKKIMTSVKAILKQAKMAHLAADVPRIETGGRHKKRLEVGRDIPTPQEVAALLAASTGRTRVLLVLTALAGLRMSEVRALRWQDVDFKERLLHVRQRADKWRRIGALKSETSYRSIPLSPYAVNTLREWRLACPKRDTGKKDPAGKAIRELQFVVPSGAGNVDTLANLWARCLAPVQAACGIVNEKGRARYGAHTLRHFFASWLIGQGFNVKRVQTLLGHSTPVVTLTTYSHLMPAEDDHERFAAGVGELVATRKPESATSPS